MSNLTLRQEKSLVAIWNNDHVSSIDYNLRWRIAYTYLLGAQSMVSGPAWDDIDLLCQIAYKYQND